MKTLMIGAALAALITAPPVHAAQCDPGYVIGVPVWDGNLPMKCVPVNNIPPGYADSTGGNPQGGMDK